MCAICHESNYDLLDVHRIDEGKEYSRANCIALCVRCHRMSHTGHLKINHKRSSGDGIYLFYEKDGIEYIAKT